MSKHATAHRLAASDTTTPDVVAAAYAHCWEIASSHYENFTVGSWLLPRQLRRHIAAVYAFARTADDIADEGSLPAAARLERLAASEQALDDAYAGEAREPIFVALADTARRFDIPIEPFRKLLDAFRQDASFQRFPDFAALRAYCERSANPVGHVILYLFGYRDVERQRLSDQICSGLQLANFWQDLSVDCARGRLYLPLDELARFGCRVDDVMAGLMSNELRALLVFQVERARGMLTDGLRLADLVERRLAREVRLFAWGGLAVLDHIEAQGFNVMQARPTLTKAEKGRLVWRALIGRGGSPAGSIADTVPALAGVGSTPTPSAPPALDAAYSYCQEVTRRSSSNFYYAFRLLSPERRNALNAVYAFCRFVDDIADDAGRRDPARLLDRWRDELGQVYAGTARHPIGCALADSVQRFPLNQRHFLDLIRGVEMDLSRRRYETFDDLYEYCYLVASTVGLLCIEIFGYRHASACQYAVDLGIAFQLTNILRDVMEDGRRGRIYLPLTDLRRFECTEDELLAGQFSARVADLMAFECRRARDYYARARGVLHPDDRGSLAAAEAMRLIYRRLLHRIEARRFDVFGPKVTVPRYEKLTLALAAWGRSQLSVLKS